MSDDVHDISIAVWDVPSPLVVGTRASLKVGVSCACGCTLTGAIIEIRDDQGASRAAGHVGAEPWPGTSGLHWVELDIAPLDEAGTRTWRVEASVDDSLHRPVESVINFVTSGPPDHRLMFEVVEQGSGAPLGGVELRVGAFTATTNHAGRAHVDVPQGTYDVHAWKLGYDLLSRTASVGTDTTLQLQIPVTRSPEPPYWM